MTYRNKKLLDAANGVPCMRCYSTGTTVACHSNSLEHGRGYGHKAPDYFVAYLCQECHSRVDGRMGAHTKEEKREMWARAWMRTVAYWFENGIVRVK